MHLLRNGLLTAIFIFSTGICFADDKVENPEYKQWAKFKPGSSVTLTYELAGAGNPGRPMEFTLTLLEITPEQAVIDQKGWQHSGKKVIPAMVEKKNLPSRDPTAEVKESTAELEVAGTKVKCNVIQVTIDFAVNRKETTTTWTSDKVPGGLVKEAHGLSFVAVNAMTIK